MSKWRKTMNIHWAKTKFKIEWEGSYPVKCILSDPFFTFMCSLHLVFYPKSPGFLTLISRFLVFWGWEVCSQLRNHADMDTSLASSKSVYPQNQMYVSYTSRNPLQSCLVFHSIFNLLLKTSFWANFDSSLRLKITSVVQAERSQSCASYLNVCRRLLYIPSLQGPYSPSIVTFAYFSRVGRLLQNNLKSLMEIYPVDSAIQPLNNRGHWGPCKNCSLFLIFRRIRSEPTIGQQGNPEDWKTLINSQDLY